MNIIDVKNLTKIFNGKTKAVDHVSFKVRKGEIFGFLGPNGAGKTTTINMLATLITPTDGTATINNFDIIHQKDKVRKSIGLIFQDPSLDDRLTAEENLRFHARLYKVNKKDYKKRLEQVLKLVDLWKKKNNLVKTFSGGMKRRLEIARGLIHYPQVLFLDEPTLGLDPQSRVNIWDYILKIKKEHQTTIFMSTHYMEEAEYCDRIAIIDYGKIVALDTPSNLKKMIGGDIMRIKSREKNKLKKELEIKYKLKVKEINNILQTEVFDGEKFLPRLLQAIKIKIKSVELRKPTLDDVFLSLTGRKIREEEASTTDRMRERMHMRMRH